MSGPSKDQSAAEIALAYHQRTKHRLERYAAGPETLDWDAQPNPFREFAGATRIALPLASDHVVARFDQLGAVAPAPLSLAAVSVLLELSMGLSAWKEYGPDRWAVRCNPSSGNLHPTEAYVLARQVPGLPDGLYHYVSRDHVLERRHPGSPAVRQLCIGLSSVHWREAWKYGERAFRYCQLDAGHALGAIRYAAAALGWRARVLDHLGADQIAGLLGLDRAQDFAGAEREDADLLLAIETETAAPIEPAGGREWSGQANLLDPHPMYRWPVIEEAATATRGIGMAAARPDPVAGPAFGGVNPGKRAADVILNRRSAQRFDRSHQMSADSLFRILAALSPARTVPWDIWDHAPAVHPILFIHRVEGIAPGLYALPRRPGIIADMKSALGDSFEWSRVESAPPQLALFRLQAGDGGRAIRTLSCHQAIAADSCFSMALLAEFEPHVAADPWRYRQLHWEAGLLGQTLYLEAEAIGLCGTGIGCFFDDEVHNLLGLGTARFQSIYHFTIGRALTDQRIASMTAYPGRRRNEAGLSGSAET